DSCPVSYFAARLGPDTVPMARGFPAVCAFVHDVLDGAVLEALAEHGTRLIAMRCAGFNNVDTEAARRVGLTVARVPAYSPYSIAEHTVALMLALNRNIHRAHARVREGNFELNGLMGFDLYGRTVGIVGTGQIGARVAAALSGFGVQLLGHDLHANPDCLSLGMRYVSLDQLFAESDIVTLHCPLTSVTHRLVNAERLALCKPGMMLINTGRGALIDAQAVIAGLKSGRIGYLGLDVYEQEESLFFHDRSNEVLQDDVFSRLQTFPNVLVTGHQGFFTRDALAEIARVTLDTVQAFGRGEPIPAARVVVDQKSGP
ncbi:MAG: 2-hydroxyacid dehydrogenase, partial [Candidatus Competibacteraceae bacterium]|nr:2-hydroxyacid dehydrogenase [Candidatus Competibacteraceae bacterium]